MSVRCCCVSFFSSLLFSSCWYYENADWENMPVLIIIFFISDYVFQCYRVERKKILDHFPRHPSNLECGCRIVFCHCSNTNHRKWVYERRQKYITIVYETSLNCLTGHLDKHLFFPCHDDISRWSDYALYIASLPSVQWCYDRYAKDIMQNKWWILHHWYNSSSYYILHSANTCDTQRI